MIQPKQKNPLYRAFSPEKVTTARFTLSQPLFRGLREFAALRQQRDLLDAARAGESDSLALVYEAVASSYFEVLAYEQDLVNLEDLRRLYGDRVKNLQGRVKRGESARNEPLTAQTSEAVIEAEIQVIRTNLKSARENFSYLTGLAADTALNDTPNPDVGVSKVKDLNFYLGRLQDRPDVVRAKKNAEASAEAVNIAKGAHWPTLDLEGNYYIERSSDYLDGLDWDIMFKLSLPLYEGGLLTAQTREASSIQRESELEFSRTRRSAEAEVRSLHEGLVMRVSHLDALKRATELSRNNSQVLERDFRRGLTRSLEVQAALTDYGNARRTYDQARFAARLDLIRLERAANILPPMIQDYARKD